jgi:hypothetical protein
MSPSITSLDFPPASRISHELEGADFFDSYQMPLPHEGRSALEIYLNVISRTPTWVNFLMSVRNWAASLIGLKNLGHLGGIEVHEPSEGFRVGDRLGIFSIETLSDDEVILGDSDKHVDVKVAVCKLVEEGREAVAVTTVVHIHNLVGHIYMALVAPVHRLIVPAVLARAVAAS